jgi:hypothetical protein
VRYERVNLADIESSSEDDYGKLFATERSRFARTPSVGRRNKSGKSKTVDNWLYTHFNDIILYKDKLSFSACKGSTLLRNAILEIPTKILTFVLRLFYVFNDSTILEGISTNSVGVFAFSLLWPPASEF